VKKFRAAVIGLGGISEMHTEFYRNSPHTKLVGVCDVAEEWMRKCQRNWGAAYASIDWQEIAVHPEVDLVSVCLPNQLHAPVTIAALEAGKHVLCEKPPALTVAEAKQMAEAARESGKVFMTSFNYRFMRSAQQMQRLVDSGAVGAIYFARATYRRQLPGLPTATSTRSDGQVYDRNWFNERSKAGGSLLDLGCHVADLALYCMGFPKVQCVFGMAANKFLPRFLAGSGRPSDADDHSMGMAKLANGAMLAVEASYGCFGDDVFGIELMGDRGALVMDWEGVRLSTETDQFFTTTRIRADESPERSVLEHFVCVVRGEEEPIILPEHGVTVMEVLEGIYRSAGWV